MIYTSKWLKSQAWNLVVCIISLLKGSLQIILRHHWVFSAVHAAFSMGNLDAESMLRKMRIYPQEHGQTGPQAQRYKTDLSTDDGADVASGPCLVWVWIAWPSARAVPMLESIAVLIIFFFFYLFSLCRKTPNCISPIFLSKQHKRASDGPLSCLNLESGMQGNAVQRFHPIRSKAGQRSKDSIHILNLPTQNESIKCFQDYLFTY